MGWYFGSIGEFVQPNYVQWEFWVLLAPWDKSDYGSDVCAQRLNQSHNIFAYVNKKIRINVVHDWIYLDWELKLRRDPWQKTARLILLKVGQSTWKNPIRFMAKRKRGVASHFWAHKIHVKELFWLAQSQCYGIRRKKLIWGCQGSLLKCNFMTFLFGYFYKWGWMIIAKLKFPWLFLFAKKELSKSKIYTPT